MNRTFCFCLFFAAIRLTSVASEEEFVPWQSATIKSPELPVVGVVSVEALTLGEAYRKLTVGVFGSTHALAATDLERLKGFPLSSITLTHGPGYAPLGGHTLHLKFSRSAYDEAKKLVQETIIISVPKNAALSISGPKPK